MNLKDAQDYSKERPCGPLNECHFCIAKGFLEAAAHAEKLVEALETVQDRLVFVVNHIDVKNDSLYKNFQAACDLGRKALAEYKKTMGLE